MGPAVRRLAADPHAARAAQSSGQAHRPLAVGRAGHLRFEVGSRCPCARVRQPPHRPQGRGRQAGGSGGVVATVQPWSRAPASLGRRPGPPSPLALGQPCVWRPGTCFAASGVLCARSCVSHRRHRWRPCRKHVPPGAAQHVPGCHRVSSSKATVWCQECERTPTGHNGGVVGVCFMQGALAPPRRHAA